MKTYTIVAGVNGAGKSSLTGVLRTEITNLGKIVDENSIELIEECLEKEICFTQETTLSGHRILATVKRAIEKGYYIRLYDNENGFVAVAEYKNGEILQIGNLKPEWLGELMEYMS